MTFKTGMTLEKNLTLKFSLPTLAVMGFTTMALIAPDMMAQESADPAAEIANKSLFDLIKAGGWAMWPLGLLSVGMITLAVYNAMQLTRGKFVPPDVKQGVLANMADVRVRSAIDLAASSSSYLGRMLAGALPKVDATSPEDLGRDHVEDAVADFALRENPNYMAFIGYFSVIAQASPMIGLLGTVSGMIKAFSTMSASGGSNPDELANNISEALMTTASGLVVAIPCLFFFYFFKNKFNKLVTEAQDTGIESMNLAIATVNADQQLAKVPEGISAG